MKRARETLTPIYDEQMQKTLENVDKELMARGFYGQLPGDVLKGARATDIERAKAAAIAALGGQMQTQSEEQALATQKLAAEWAINQSNLWNQLQKQRLEAPWNFLTNFRELFPTTWTNLFGKTPDISDIKTVVSQGWTTMTPSVSNLQLSLPQNAGGLSLDPRVNLGGAYINPYSLS